MREIKFRCWYDKRMHKVVDIDFSYKRINLLGADIISFEQGILMQYTGLKDKNGKEIYEGDILIYDEDEIAIVQYSEVDAMFEIILDNIVTNFSNESSEWWRIIGNIYDNPELLKESE